MTDRIEIDLTQDEDSSYVHPSRRDLVPRANHVNKPKQRLSQQQLMARHEKEMRRITVGLLVFRLSSSGFLISIASVDKGFGEYLPGTITECQSNRRFARNSQKTLGLRCQPPKFSHDRAAWRSERVLQSF